MGEKSVLCFTEPRSGIVARSNGSPEGNEFVSLFAKICGDYEASQKDWIGALRANGVKLAHPDDGWVNRERNTIQPCYPDFDDGPATGDLIALGTHKKFRLVRVLEVERTMFRYLVYSFDLADSDTGPEAGDKTQCEPPSRMGGRSSLTGRHPWYARFAGHKSREL